MVHRRPGAKYWLNCFDRMDPIAGREYRRIREKEFPRSILHLQSLPTAPSLDSEPGSHTTKTFTDTEVEAALNRPDAPILAGIRPQEVRTVLGQRYQTLKRWAEREEDV